MGLIVEWKEAYDRTKKSNRSLIEFSSKQAGEGLISGKGGLTNACMFVVVVVGYIHTISNNQL